jgi:hypothetical protein
VQELISFRLLLTLFALCLPYFAQAIVWPDGRRGLANVPLDRERCLHEPHCLVLFPCSKHAEMHGCRGLIVALWCACFCTAGPGVRTGEEIALEYGVAGSVAFAPALIGAWTVGTLLEQVIVILSWPPR